ncbi:MAG: BtaA family protein [Planctomycetes bacterium]|nr:BtaA family protein [Planctomycetota bacterium]
MTSNVFAGAAPPLVYSEVMEDGDVVADALATRAEETVIVVASAGDNVFRAALEPCSRVLGIDINATQVEFCKLKHAAIRELDWPSFAALVGVVSATVTERRAWLDTFDRGLVERALPDDAARSAALEHGLTASGRLAFFVAPLREMLTKIVGADSLERIFVESERVARAALWRSRFDTPAVDDLLATALNEHTIGDAFIPAWAFGRMAEPRFDRHYKRVLEHLFVDLNPARNPHLQRLWLGRYLGPESAQTYLQAARFAPLRERSERIHWAVGDFATVLAGLASRSVHAFNLSNILDWSDDAHYTRLWSEIERVSARGARVFLRSFLAERALPAAVAARWRSDPGQSQRMRAADRVGYFSRWELWTRSHDG